MVDPPLVPLPPPPPAAAATIRPPALPKQPPPPPAAPAPPLSVAEREAELAAAFKARVQALVAAPDSLRLTPMAAAQHCGVVAIGKSNGALRPKPAILGTTAAGVAR